MTKMIHWWSLGLHLCLVNSPLSEAYSIACPCKSGRGMWVDGRRNPSRVAPRHTQCVQLMRHSRGDSWSLGVEYPRMGWRHLSSRGAAVLRVVITTEKKFGALTFVDLSQLTSSRRSKYSKAPTICPISLVFRRGLGCSSRIQPCPQCSGSFCYWPLRCRWRRRWTLSPWRSWGPRKRWKA